MRNPFAWGIVALVCFLILILMLLRDATAATPTLVYSVGWGAPIENEDGSAIAGAITYQLYVGAPGLEVKYKTPVSAPPYVLVPTPAPGVNTCVQVTATVNGVESARSSEACGRVPFGKPNAPGSISVTIK